MPFRPILVLGAGRSSGYLIRYLAQHSAVLECELIVADQDLDHAQAKIEGLPNCRAVALDPLAQPEILDALVKESVVVISLLPVSLHMQVAMSCLKNKVSLFTASYQSGEMEALAPDIKAMGLLFLNECGCDPGLDHMTALQIMDRLRDAGHSILSYEGYTGGLVAPVSDDNPWHYKFSWNPRNVVLAGQSGPAVYWQNNQIEIIPYPRLFRAVQPLELSGHRDLVGYFNRNSLPYRALYGLEQADTVIRGTLRHRDFCLAWFPLAYLGLNVDTNLPKEPLKWPTATELTKILGAELHYSLEETQKVIELWAFLGFWDPAVVDAYATNPAQNLEQRMVERMSLGATDRDMVVMCHRIRSKDHQGRVVDHRSELVLEGQGGENSAMAQTVGWPLAMAVECYLKGQVQETGLQRPLAPHWYQPILKGLDALGITCRETQVMP